MSVSIIRRPIAYKSNDNNINAVINESGGVPGAINIVKPTHGLSNGTVVYIKSDIVDYNGFATVEAADADNFRVLKDGSYISFIRSTSVCTYDETRSHAWQCVHLPIVYKLSNTLWPTNSADTVRTISGVTNSSGYCALSLSGDIKTTGSAAALEFVKITNSTDDELNGVWQIISYTNDTTFVISIPYSAANDTALTNATIQYYYNNYHVKVQIWGGLNNGHEYYAQKPYDLMATIDLIPDTNNQCKFSISDYLKNQIEIENNLLLGTLPNNLDAFTMFFIKYGEVYDDSDGTTLSQTTPSYTSDLTTFEGKASNSLLPFKNIYSGTMSDYILVSTNGKALTDFDDPVIFSGKYFDLSFIFDAADSIDYPIILEEYYSGNVKITETETSLAADGVGVYRAKLTDPNCIYDRVDATIHYADVQSIPNPDNWGDIVDPFTTRTSVHFQESVTSGTASPRSAYTPTTPTANSTFKITLLVTITGTWTASAPGLRVMARIIDDLLNDIGTRETTDVYQFTANGVYTINEVVAIGALGTAPHQIVLELYNSAVTSGTAVVTIVVPDTALYQIPVSETKTISIDCNCLKSKATGYYLSWLNSLGGYDYWYFTGYSDQIIDVIETGETSVNTFPNWPESYGEFADTSDRKQTYRKSAQQVLVRSQHLTGAQIESIKNIRTSPLVQIVNSIYDRRTVIVDIDSFVYLPEGKNLHEISFTITYTDDVPSQRV